MAKNKYQKANSAIIVDYLDPGDLEREGLINSSIGNPCSNHPSDHYSIGYKVYLKNTGEEN